MIDKQLLHSTQAFQQIAAASTDHLLTAQEMCDRLLTVYPDRISRIVLFGSRARGDSQEGSDFDLLVLGDFDGIPMGVRGGQLHLSIYGMGVYADILPLTEEEYGTSLMRRAIEAEGVVLYERGHRTVDS